VVGLEADDDDDACFVFDDDDDDDDDACFVFDDKGTESSLNSGFFLD